MVLLYFIGCCGCCIQPFVFSKLLFSPSYQPCFLFKHLARLSAVLFFCTGPHAGVGACQPPPPHAINELERLKKILDRGSMRVGKGRAGRKGRERVGSVVSIIKMMSEGNGFIMASKCLHSELQWCPLSLMPFFPSQAAMLTIMASR